MARHGVTALRGGILETTVGSNGAHAASRNGHLAELRASEQKRRSRDGNQEEIRSAGRARRRRKPAPTQKSKSGERPGMAWATPLATVAWPGTQPVERRGADMAAWGPHGPAWRAVVVQPAGGRGGRERKRRILKEELLGRALSSAMLVRRLRRSGSRRRSSAFTLPTVGSSGSIVTLPTVGLGGP